MSKSFKIFVIALVIRTAREGIDWFSGNKDVYRRAYKKARHRLQHASFLLQY
jgi:hypothetical protein